MSEHTKEPWEVSKTLEEIYIDGLTGAKVIDWWIVQPQSDFTGRLICNCEGMSDTEENRANARRIVACINACAGISTDELERGVIKEALGMVDRLSREITALPTDCDGQNCAACANPCENYLEALR